VSVAEDEAPTRELTLDEAVALGVALQKNEQFAEAGELYRRVLDTSPAHSAALHYSGVLAHQQGKNDEAIALIERSLALAPDQADWFSNLGIIFQSDGQLDSAIAACQRAIALNPGHANAHSNLGVLLRATGKTAEAESAYRTAIQLNPDHIDAYTNLGILLNGLGRTQEATTCYCKVITLRPKHPEARKLLALAHCALGEIGEAVRIFEEWLVEDPEDPIARHMLAACTGRDVPARASNAFVENTFDSFAASFESRLQRLSYRAPALVAAMLESSGREPSKQLDVLDAGCGTGLCGVLVAAYARRLTGVDLSGGMLARAKEKGVYDTLVEAELTAYLRDHENAFDAIVSADTLVYFGDLEEVVCAAAGALRSNGFLLFTLEDAGDREAGAGYRLETHGRYSHAGAYVERRLAFAGLQAEVVHADLRMEAGVPVAGLVIRASKP
jgi:predicted TPR repeat methyltransferase